MIVQGFLLTAVFAAIYSIHGLDGCDPAINSGFCGKPLAWDTSLYFSVVTWTTLGYGDFKPVADLRLLAAWQALLGYGLLGILVGLGAASIMSKKPT